MSRAEVLAKALAEHIYLPRGRRVGPGCFGCDWVPPSWMHRDEQIRNEHRAHVAAALDAALAAQEGERGGAEVEWPCADYKPPITCLTTPKPKTLLCDWCRAQPNGAEVQALYARALATRDAEVLRAAADEIGPFYGAVLVGPVGDAFCTGWDAALAAVRERADRIEARS